jgi:hypothetical protein
MRRFFDVLLDMLYGHYGSLAGAIIFFVLLLACEVPLLWAARLTGVFWVFAVGVVFYLIGHRRGRSVACLHDYCQAVPADAREKSHE